jgi:hypothetical protein
MQTRSRPPREYAGMFSAGRRKSEPDWHQHARRVPSPEFNSSCIFFQQPVACAIENLSFVRR